MSMAIRAMTEIERKHNKEEVDFIRPYGPKTKVQITFAKKGRTKQSFKDECDINLIIDRHTKGQVNAHVNAHIAEYGFATGDDFATCMRTVTQAQEMFDGLPSAIRNRFANSPANFLDFFNEANNQEEGEKLGLWPKLAVNGSNEPKETLADKDRPEKSEPKPEKE